jgi:hypothetical protein
MDLDKDSLKKMFPNLARELKDNENRVRVNSVRTDREKAAVTRSFDGYVPDVVDFFRRCDTEGQAEEIIAFLEKRGEIDKECAERFMDQLKKKGVRSFGSKKEHDYYLRKTGRS